MRGILACWIRQADQIEHFKKHQCNKFALHSKFNLKNGDIIYTSEDYPHLQVAIVIIGRYNNMRTTRRARAAINGRWYS